MTKHVQQRMDSRVHPQHQGIADRLAAMAYDHYSTALVAPVNSSLSLVVIARSFAPVTVFYRENSRVTPSHLKVDTVKQVTA